MSIIVQKYGGSSVKDPAHLRKVAALIKARRDEGHRMCVVVSAMGDTTDELLAQAAELSPKPPRRELDMLLTCGERATMALLAMALDDIGVESISFTGSQSGIITNDAHSGARILEVRPYRVQDELERGRVVIVAGFQGVSYRKEITTLGRGGTDTTAVALAAALSAEACEIYSDVPGVFSADPRVVEDAAQIDEISAQQMSALAEGGAKVLAPQAVAYAMDKGIALYAKKTGSDDPGTLVRKDPVFGANTVAVAHRDEVWLVSAADVAELSAHCEKITAHGARIAFCLASSWPGRVAVVPDDAHGLAALLAPAPIDRDHGTITVTGRSPAYAGGPGPVLAVLAQAGVRVHAMLAVPGSTTAILDKAAVAPAVRALHAALRTGSVI